MGWTPRQVDALGLGEFDHAWRGWLKAQGADPDRRPFGLADLERLKKKAGHV